MICHYSLLSLTGDFATALGADSAAAKDETHYWLRRRPRGNMWLPSLPCPQYDLLLVTGSNTVWSGAHSLSTAILKEWVSWVVGNKPKGLSDKHRCQHSEAGGVHYCPLRSTVLQQNFSCSKRDAYLYKTWDKESTGDFVVSMDTWPQKHTWDLCCTALAHHYWLISSKPFCKRHKMATRFFMRWSEGSAVQPKMPAEARPRP